jgi:hypothetical protein
MVKTRLVIEESCQMCFWRDTDAEKVQDKSLADLAG